MPDDTVESLQHLLQDVIAPDVRELKVRLTSLEKQMDVQFEAMEQRFVSGDQKIIGLEQKMDVRFEAVDRRFEALENKMDVQFQAIMAAIGESRAQSELTSVRLIAALSERVAVLESRIH